MKLKTFWILNGPCSYIFINFTRNVHQQPASPKWFTKSDDLIKWGEVREQTDHFKKGKWGGNYRNEQPLWATTTELESENTLKQLSIIESSKIIEAYKQSKLFLTKLWVNNEKKNKFSDMLWSELGFDPILSDKFTELTSKNPTLLQARVLPFVIGHIASKNPVGDIMFSSKKQSGKTLLFLIGILHALRCEDSGLNLVLCKDSLTCIHLYNKFNSILQPADSMSIFHPWEAYRCVLLAAYRDDAADYAVHMFKSINSPQGPIRVVITTPDVWNEMQWRQTKGRLNMEKFGYYRRIYVDDVQKQLNLPDNSSTTKEYRERDANPSAIELCLAHISSEALTTCQSTLSNSCRFMRTFLPEPKFILESFV